MYYKIIQKLNNKHIAILGYGREGKSTYRFIKKYCKNTKVTIIDYKDIRNDFYNEFNDEVDFITGEDYLNNLEKYDLIIKTPGISLKDIDISTFENKISSQVELLLEVYKNNCIGITGTKGKSTTSSLIYKILKDQNKDTYLVGNIGEPVFDNIENYKEETTIVIELSSHQLEFLNVSPHIGLVLNLFEDHLDHAGSLYHYHQIKLNMFRNQNSDDIGIYNFDNEYLKKYISEEKFKSKLLGVSLREKKDTYKENDIVYFQNKVLYDINTPRLLLGEHNTANIIFSLIVADTMNLDINKAIQSISTFKPLDYRLQCVGNYNDITFYVDTLATIPEATIQSIETLNNVDTLIFGGMDRGIDYKEFINYLNNSSINNLICMPSTGYKIGKEIINKNVYYISDLEEAVKKTKEVTSKDKICLLSPAASSYEYFKNYAEKAEAFIKYVKNI
jgi:UDP-N-acetylmuramoylalanine--D-glutamate ligase